MSFSTDGYFALRSKLAYGNTMSTVGPPIFESPMVKVKLGLVDDRLLCNASSTQYIAAVSFQTKPKVRSKASHASRGR